MNTKNTRGAGARAALIVLLLLLCAVVTAGCGKDKKQNDTAVTVTGTPAATATPVPATPTPTVSFVKATYEAIGDGNVYRLPIAEAGVGKSCFCVQVAGEYALFNVSDNPDDGTGETPVTTTYVLAKPLQSSDFRRFEPGYPVGVTTLFQDGSFLMEDAQNQVIHLYDNTMTEVRKYTYPENLYMVRYLGEADGKWCFSATNIDYEQTCLYLSKTGDGTAVGEEPSGLNTEDIALKNPYGWDFCVDDSLPATWYLHELGKPREAIVFPMARIREIKEILNGMRMVGRGDYVTDGESEGRDFRLYNLEKGTVSEALPESAFSEKVSLRADEIIGDNCVIFVAAHPDTSAEVLLWIPQEETPIAGFCDFSKAEPGKAMNELLDMAAAEGIVITTEPLTDDGSAETLKEILYEYDFAGKFILARRNNPELFPASAETIHPENMRNNTNGHYEFNPHVFSEFYTKEYGEARRQALFNYVDAARAGEDWFDCPDLDTMWWCMGRLGHFFYPVGPEYTFAGDYRDGKGEITYKIPKEEFAAKVQEFEKKIIDIVNDAVGDDYTDMEKALALYEFLTEYATYDYEMLAHCTEWMDRQGGYRILMEKTGICNEFACLYQYLLQQCGVKAEESGGPSLTYGADSHAWVYVTIDGKGYLVDPTWGETGERAPALAYFLFTDELRQNRDGFNAAKFDVAGAGEDARRKYSFEAKDTRFEPLWDGKYVAMDRATKSIYYLNQNGNLCRFDYGTAEN